MWLYQYTAVALISVSISSYDCEDATSTSQISGYERTHGKLVAVWPRRGRARVRWPQTKADDNQTQQGFREKDTPYSQWGLRKRSTRLTSVTRRA